MFPVASSRRMILAFCSKARVRKINYLSPMLKLCPLSVMTSWRTLHLHDCLWLRRLSNVDLSGHLRGSVTIRHGCRENQVNGNSTITEILKLQYKVAAKMPFRLGTVCKPHFFSARFFFLFYLPPPPPPPLSLFFLSPPSFHLLILRTY